MTTHAPLLPRDMQCAYRSKFCAEPRAIKLDGSQHKLCDFHRRKANANQQRLHKRKKCIMAQQGGEDAPQTPRSKRPRLQQESPQSTTEPIDGLTFQSSFDLLEVKILQVLLFDSENISTSLRRYEPLKDEILSPVSPTTLMFHDTWSVTL